MAIELVPGYLLTHSDGEDVALINWSEYSNIPHSEPDLLSNCQGLTAVLIVTQYPFVTCLKEMNPALTYNKLLTIF